VGGGIGVAVAVGAGEGKGEGEEIGAGVTVDEGVAVGEAPPPHAAAATNVRTVRPDNPRRIGLRRRNTAERRDMFMAVSGTSRDATLSFPVYG